MDTHDVTLFDGAVKPGIPDTTIDFVTVATSHGPLLTKHWRRNAAGEPHAEDYGSAKVFDFTQKPVRNLDDLANVVADISPTQCLILGKVKDGVSHVGARRLLHDQKDGTASTIEDTAHCWLPIDADSIPANDKRGEFDPLTDPQRAIDCIVKQLPDEFAGADCVYQWTSSAGMKPGIRMRLFFWLSRPLTGAEMKAWLLGCPVDTSIYTPTQPIYAAAPIFDGIADPIPQRTGAVRGWSPSVMPPAIIAAQTREPRTAPEGFEPDRPENVEQYRRYLCACIAKATPLEASSGHWSRDGDMSTFRLAAVGKDKGLSPERTVELLIAELPGGIGADEEWLEITVKNAFGYGSSAPGCDAIPTNEQVFADVDPATSEEQPTAAGGGMPRSFAERLRDSAAKGVGGHKPPPMMPLFMSLGELFDYQFPPTKDIWQGFIPEQLVTLLYADGGTGKTLLSEWIAIHVAAGLPLFGRATVQQPVILVLCEDRHERVRAAIGSICAQLGIKPGWLPITLCCTPSDPLLAAIGDKGEVAERPFLKELCDRIAATGRCLVVLDTVSDIAELNENLRLPPNNLCKRILQPICSELGATILVNCHPSAAQMNQGRMGSGSTAWRNAVRNVVVLFGDEGTNDWLTLSNQKIHGGKASYGECEPLRLWREGVIFSQTSIGTGPEEGKFHPGFMALCVECATHAAEMAEVPIKRPTSDRGKVWSNWLPQGHWVIQRCNRECGFQPTPKLFWTHLAEAARRGYLTYRKSSEIGGKGGSGYYRGERDAADLKVQPS